jgi:hypothetical protein
MKLPVLKSCNCNVMMILALCVITLLGSCHDENDNPCKDGNNREGSASEKPQLVLDLFNPQDHGNDGNASDIFLTCKFSGTLDRFEKLRFFLKSSSSDINLGSALTLPAGSYVEVGVAAHIEVSFPPELVDAYGNPILEGKPYSIFILGVATPCSAAPILIEGSQTLTLKDEIVVLTPRLKSTLPANEDISVDENYNLFLAGGSITTSSFFKVTPDGTVTTLSTALNYGVGNVLDDNGNLYVTNFGSVDINYVTSTGITSVFISDPKLFRGGGIILANDGALYNTFWPIKTIYKITAGSVENFLTSDLLNGPVGLAYDKVNDHIFVSNFNDGKIFRITSDKTITEVADLPASIGHLEYRDNVLYATGFNENKVFVVSTDGEILATIGNGNGATVDGPAADASFLKPNGIGVSKDGKYVFISQYDGTLRKIVL